MRFIATVLSLLMFALPAFGQSSRARSGAEAPGIVDNRYASPETLAWIWELDSVPFPNQIDNGSEWTDYYFSFEGPTFVTGINGVTGVDDTTEIITSTSHGLTTGLAVNVAFEDGPLPAPLEPERDYFVIWVSANTFQLATTEANAIAGTAIDLTDSAAAATFSIKYGGGLLPAGSDSLDCLTPETACASIDKLRTTIFAGGKRRANLDEDTWTDGGGNDTWFGRLEDGDVTTTGCQIAANNDWRKAIEEPCWWIRPMPGTSKRPILDSTGSDGAGTEADFFAMRTETQRAAVLIEGMDLICDNADNNGSPCIDTFDGGIAITVGVNMTVSDDNGGGSSSLNVFSCHDASITSVYGGDFYGYREVNGADYASMGANFGTQDSCALSIHSNGIAEGGQTSATGGQCPVAAIQSSPADATIPTDADLLVEVGEQPLEGLITGLHMQQCGAPNDEAGSRTVQVQADDNASLSGIVNATFIGTVFDTHPTSDVDNPVNLAIAALEAGTTANVTVLNSTFRAFREGGDATTGIWHVNVPNGSIADTTTTLNLTLAGNIFETSIAGANQFRHFNFVEDNIYKSNSVIKLYDNVTSIEANAFRFCHSGTNCTTADTEVCFDTQFVDVVSCLDANAPADYTDTYVIQNNVNATDANSGTASGGGGESLVDTGIGWTAGDYVDCWLHNTSISNGEGGRIVRNTTDTLYIEAEQATDNANTHNYSIECPVLPTRGDCNTDDSCADAVADRSVYDVDFDERLWIPRYISGITLEGYRGQPETYTNAGRITGD